MSCRTAEEAANVIVHATRIGKRVTSDDIEARPIKTAEYDAFRSFTQQTEYLVQL